MFGIDGYLCLGVCTRIIQVEQNENVQGIPLTFIIIHLIIVQYVVCEKLLWIPFIYWG